MRNLWAPWRLAYIKDGGEEPGCFFCQAWADVGSEAGHLLLARGEAALVIMNRFPYNNGHLMIAPIRHAGRIEEMSEAEAAELWRLTVTCKQVIQDAMNPGGFNIGINQGHCGGAGVLDHLHIHIVPRWEGDTNFMPVLGETKVMPQYLEECYAQLRPGFEARGL